MSSADRDISSSGLESMPRASRPTAIVTGGAGAGIGTGITAALARRGWAVLIVDVDEQRIRVVRKSLEAYEVDGLPLDVTSPDASSVAVDHALHKYGRLDGLVNNAGVGLCKPVAEVQDAEFERILEVNFCAAFRFCRAAIPAMLSRGGSIVNIGSIHAHRTIRGYAVYAAIKCALEGLTRGLAADYGPQNVRANCVHPGLVMSAQNRELIGCFTSDVDGWLSSYAATKQLLPEVLTSGQVGNLAAFLLDPESTGITGQAINIDGGTSAMLFDREAQS
jgi:NAD(P)-dependent dehydrogenase (short-subunit alcohol dehydrogenase family)